jgi:hypothetical protein
MFLLNDILAGNKFFSEAKFFNKAHLLKLKLMEWREKLTDQSLVTEEVFITYSFYE